MGLVFEFLPQLGREVSPDVLAARVGVLAGRLEGLGRGRTTGHGAGGRALLLAGLLTGPAHAANHHPAHRRPGTLHVFDELIDLFDDLLLLVPRALASVGLA